MPSTASVLLLGQDEQLLQTRRWVLESAGLQVYTATHFLALNRALADHQVDLLILCHSLTTEECDRAIAIVEAHPPKLKILALTTASSGTGATKADQAIDTAEGSKTLLSIVSGFMKNRVLPDSSP